MQTSPLTLWRDAEQLVRVDEHRAAELYARLVHDPDVGQPSLLRLSLIAERRGDYRQAVEHAVAAAAIATTDADSLAMLCKRLFTLGEVEASIWCASHPAIASSRDAQLLAEVGKVMTDALQPGLALRLLQRARALGLDSPGLSYLIAIASMYRGDIDAAETELTRCLRAAPGYARAHWARSKLRRWGPDSHHVDLIRRTIVAAGPGHRDLPLLHYALFKELDDLDDTPAAWEALESGMQARRRQLDYDAARDRALVEHLIANPVTDGVEEPDDGPSPLFIVGMPRSGTTLLERILANHPDIADAGELHDFVLQLRWTCNRAGAPYLDLDLAERAMRADWTTLGRRYLGHTRFHAGGRRFYTDKMPANFVNVGYILRALPQARVVHVTRGAMDTCFSNLKELFAGAYPHSYDQLEMAEHFLGYRRLMTHWHDIAPGRVLDVAYESLVSAPDDVAKRILAHCGLPPHGSLARIEGSAGVVATASSVQVREGIHTRNVGQWRRYARQLDPLRARLEC